MRILKENSICIVIDIQERLFPVMANKEGLLKNCQTLISGFNELMLPVIVTQQYTKGLGNTVPEITDCIPNFKYIEKTAFSCYDEPTFVENIEEFNVQNVIICGIESHVCVMQTAIDLKEAGYRPIVVADCISSRSEQNKMLAIERFKHEGIMAVSCESILFELVRDTASAHFKAISKLVK
jgi:nicotinamidase-related amidase